ncbi:MAG: hypothetical protein K8S97_08520 [Anaerolineae bacterium]|nr:hypothetical protein [Anaerolineae bacterium]
MVAQSTAQHNTPTWRAKLHQRAISDLVIDYCQIRSNGRGWVIPITPSADGFRWKAYPNQRGPKTRWADRHGKPASMPENARFYDPRGELAQHVDHAGGVLILAAGEPDVWALMTGGIFNATCTMKGEGSIPDWLMPGLQRLGVHTVRYYPDRDQKGDEAARKLRDALADSGIALEVYTLPDRLGEKGDINTLLFDVGAGGLADALADCAPYDMPPPEDREPSKPSHQRDPASIPAAYNTLWDQWCAELDRAVPEEWKRGKPNAKGYYKNIPCPFHDEHNPSAGYNTNTQTITCFVCGDHNQHEIAALIGSQAWEDYKAQHAPAPTLPPPIMKKQEPEPRDYSARALRWNFTNELRTMLLNLHAETAETNDRDVPKWADFPDYAPAVMVLDIVTSAENSNRIALGETLAEQDIYALAQHGETRHTIRTGIEILEQTGVFCRKTPRVSTYKNPLGDFQQKGQSSRAARGPSVFWVLNDPDIALDNLVGTLRDNAMRTAVYAPPGERVLIPDSPRTDEPYDLTAAQVEQVDQRRAPLYEQHAAARAKAERTINRRARVLRRALADACQRANKPADPIPVDVETPNKLHYRAALDRLHLEACGGVRLEPDAVTMARIGCKYPQQLRHIREINQVATVARHKTHPIRRDMHVFDQVPDYTVRRGWGLKLEASNGETYLVVRKDKTTEERWEEADRWTQRQFAGGATVEAKERIASFERSADEQERRAIAARIERRKEKAKEYRMAIKVQERKPTVPRPPETPPNQHSEFYAAQQAKFGLSDFTPYRMQDDTLLSTITGREWKAPTAAQLWRAWAGTLEDIQGATMPTFTAHSEPAEREPEVYNVTAEYDDLRAHREHREPRLDVPATAVYQQREHIDAINAAAKVTHGQARDHVCYECGKPADVQTFMGWRCAECHKAVVAA